jgi:ASTRA-associated protein 1
MKPLGVLEYHKESCSSVVFAKDINAGGEGDACEGGDDDDDDMTWAEQVERSRWLAAGGKDSRVSIWALMSFGKT